MKHILTILTFVVIFTLPMLAESQNPQTVGKIIAGKVESKTLATAMLDSLNRHPNADRWSGVDEKQVFGISMVPFTNQDVQDDNISLLRTTARLIAAKEMLCAKVLLDKYAEFGLTDTGSLREAVVQANESFSMRGKITYSMEETIIEKNSIVGIVVADRNMMEEMMTNQSRIDTVRTAYQDVVSRQAKRQINDKRYNEALGTMLALRQSKLLVQEHYFDILRCFVGLEKPVDAEKIVAYFLVDHSEDVSVLRRLVVITASGKNNAFQELTHKLQKEIERLDTTRQTTEQVLKHFLNELLGQSPVQ